MKKEYLIVIILTLIIVALLGVLFFVPAKPKENGQKKVQPVQQIISDGLEITFPNLGEEISSPLKISGITNGNGWIGFEGQVGTVELLDGNGKSITPGFLTAQGEWMSSSVKFETLLNFATPETEKGTLIFRNENPSGMPENSRMVSVPVKFSKEKTIGVGVFLGNLSLSSSGEQDPCKRVYKSVRYVKETQAVAKTAIEELLKGLTNEETMRGFFTSIPDGSKLNSIKIENGVAKADFNSTTESGGGSCSMAGRVAQITQTLMQFPTIKSVEISVNGKTGDEIFQP